MIKSCLAMTSTAENCAQQGQSLQVIDIMKIGTESDDKVHNEGLVLHTLQNDRFLPSVN